MKENRVLQHSRQDFMIASAGLILPRPAWTKGRSRAALCWTLCGHDDVARESVGGSDDPISSRTGHAIWVGEGRDRALRLDGYSFWIDHPVPGPTMTAKTLTIAAWVALESFPVNDAALVQFDTQGDFQMSFELDRWGYIQLRTSSGGPSALCKATTPLPKAEWVHVSVTVSATGEVILYADGRRCGGSTHGGRLRAEASPAIRVGKSNRAPSVASIFPTGVLNGLLKDVRVFDRQLPQDTILEILEESKPGSAPDLDINGPWCAADKQRPLYHAQPPRAWTNEPHGLIHWSGEYHLFYQKNPSGPYWGHIHWGHMTSPDLYRWTEMPVALSPEPGADAEGCWSGSVIDHDGKLALIYIGGDGHRSSICLAQSSDGIHFDKYAGNPIIPEPPQGPGFPEFRDPFVWKEGAVYYLLIGSAVKNVGGTALLYRSTDLIHWEYRKPLLIGDHETSGVFWEMPSFVKVSEHHALIVCEVPGRTSYWVGKWEDETFTPYTTAPRHLELFNHLLSPTPHTDAAGQVIIMGIIPDERDPSECWGAGWAHLYSLPRLLSADEGGYLHQQPLSDLLQWFDPVVSIASLAITAGPPSPVEGASGTQLHLRFLFKRGNSDSVSLLMRRSPDGREQTELRYEWNIGELVLDRRRSSINPLAAHDVEDVIYFPAQKDLIEVEAFLDNSVLEVFVDNRAAFATRIYPALNISQGIALQSSGGGAEVLDLAVAKMRLLS